MAATTPKKITYTSDFKLKVLVYYFKHGGDENFGLKTKTANHFSIDKKTINRMLKNPEMVKRAKRLQARRIASSTSSSNPSASSSTASARRSAKGSRAAGSKGGSGTTKAASSPSQGSGGGGRERERERVKCQHGPEGVEVLELPEDPDFSQLRQSIKASADGVVNLANLLVNGTEEVRRVLVNECNIIIECKVCTSLFRSTLNFLYHKGVYCKKCFADVKTLFGRDGDHDGLTSQSGTVFVEPEAPPPTPPPTTAPPVPPQPPTQATEGGRSQRRIDAIADRLSGRSGGQNCRPGSSGKEEVSSSTHTGSARYYERLQRVNAARDKLSQDCSVVLKDIRGVTNARYQAYQPVYSPAATPPAASASAQSKPPGSVEVPQGSSNPSGAPKRGGEEEKKEEEEEEEEEEEDSSTVQLMCRLCKGRFSTHKAFAAHQRTSHGLEGVTYSCPICQVTFITMWATLKHLEKVHKKSKHQIERLKRVVRMKMVKKSSTAAAGKKEEEEGGGGGGGGRRMSQPRSPAVNQSQPPSTTTTTSSRKSYSSRSSHKTYESGSSVQSEHRCGKCERRFMTPQALISHEKFCSLQQMRPPTAALLPKSPLSPRLRSETPEKPISIQIRKDYKKMVCEDGTDNADGTNTTADGTDITNHGTGKGSQGTKMTVHGADGSTGTSMDGTATDRRLSVPSTGTSVDGTATDRRLSIPSTGTIANKVDALMSKLCQMSTLSCVPCGRRYQTITTLKRHVSVHLNWTRYACCRCDFRSYNRYEMTHHASSQHGVPESSAGDILVEDVAFGPVRYSLKEEEEEEEEEEVKENGIEEEDEALTTPIDSATVPECHNSKDLSLTTQASSEIEITPSTEDSDNQEPGGGSSTSQAGRSTRGETTETAKSTESTVPIPDMEGEVEASLTNESRQKSPNHKEDTSTEDSTTTGMSTGNPDSTENATGSSLATGRESGNATEFSHRRKRSREPVDSPRESPNTQPTSKRRKDARDSTDSPKRQPKITPSTEINQRDITKPDLMEDSSSSTKNIESQPKTSTGRDITEPHPSTETRPTEKLQKTPVTKGGTTEHSTELSTAQKSPTESRISRRSATESSTESPKPQETITRRATTRASSVDRVTRRSTSRESPIATTASTASTEGNRTPRPHEPATVSPTETSPGRPATRDTPNQPKMTSESVITRRSLSENASSESSQKRSSTERSSSEPRLPHERPDSADTARGHRGHAAAEVRPPDPKRTRRRNFDQERNETHDSCNGTDDSVEISADGGLADGRKGEPPPAAASYPSVLIVEEVEEEENGAKEERERSGR